MWAEFQGGEVEVGGSCNLIDFRSAFVVREIASTEYN